MNSSAKKLIKIGVILLLIGYLFTGIFGVPAVHKRIRRDAVAYHREVPRVTTVVDFRYTFPVLPGVIVSRYDIGDGPFWMEGHRKFFVFIFGSPREVHKRIVWIS